MENVSVAILCPLRKMPNEPESTNWAALSLVFSLSTAATSVGNSTIPAIPIRIVTANLTSHLLVGTFQSQSIDDLVHNLFDFPTAGFHADLRPQVTGAARPVELIKCLFVAPQRTLDRVRSTPAPQFLRICVEIHGGYGFACQQGKVLRFQERPATQCQNQLHTGPGIFHDLPEGSMLGAPEFTFARIPENFADRPALARLDPVVEILETPTQAIAQS